MCVYIEPGGAARTVLGYRRRGAQGRGVEQEDEQEKEEEEEEAEEEEEEGEAEEEGGIKMHQR